MHTGRGYTEAASTVFLELSTLLIVKPNSEVRVQSPKVKTESSDVPGLPTD